MAEARFIRAFWYFNLVITFGGVPLVTTTLAPSEYAQPALLTRFGPNPSRLDRSLRTSARKARSARTRQAGTSGQPALLAVCLYQSKYAESELAWVIQSGEYSLAIDYGSIFTESSEMGKAHLGNPVRQRQRRKLGAQFWSEGTYTMCSSAHAGRSGLRLQFANARLRGRVSDVDRSVERQRNHRVDARLGYTVYTVGDTIADWGVLSEEATDMPHPTMHEYFNPASELAPFGDPNPMGVERPRDSLRGRAVDALESCNRLGFDDEAKESLKMVWGVLDTGKTNSIPVSTNATRTSPCLEPRRGCSRPSGANARRVGVGRAPLL